MRPTRIAAWTSLALAVTATAFAGPVTIWAVDPATDLIFRIDPGTGGAKGAVPAPVPRELAMELLPTHVVVPGDTLLVQPVELDAPLRLPPDQPVQPDGTIDLGI